MNNYCGSGENYNIGINQDARILSVLNYGAFIAIVVGEYYIGKMKYTFSKTNLLVLEEFRLNIPIEAVNVHLEVYSVDITGYIKIFSKDYAKADDACFLVWGLSFVPQYKEIPCTSPGMLQSILPEGAIVPYDKCLNSCCCNGCSYTCNRSCINPCGNYSCINPSCINPYNNCNV
ncbi:hypothetical protein IRP63_04940 [Clostridium botulinum]|uniref:hypothetical protein n=1 Tax=Clostridium botulinum TaxID=1491 RepID=UPI00068A9BD4|nr:hypothetical protein [Clostridium botulinum]MCD3233468.1 hypothetical protein [Clostridium botulinum D/C]MCD3239218.1 hypothetical protein [Clostridium botulinum D/C]MCD3266888.1 hypothetical protein [Clostridium botulinum D/C]MCD3298755.1 hypothetical protein [Clostridium botulinum D/C]MCD3305126.1 hypothetical protein [Clostridium botulinum D/C]